MLIFSVGFFTWLAPAPGGHQRRPHGPGRAAAGEARRREGAGLARPGLHRADRHGRSAPSSWSSGRSSSRPRWSSRPPAPRHPNPSKAPWYFLGLQEMLVYFDPWMAGVVLPTMIIVGLIAMPYIDFNQKGNGYFTFDQRKFAIIDVPVRLPRPVGDADRAGHVPARAELELLRPVRVLGPAQGRAAEQRQPVGLSSG